MSDTSVKTASADISEARRALGRRLRTLRIEHALTGERLAHNAAMSPSKVSKIELGRVAVTDTTVTRLAAAMRLSDEETDELLRYVRAAELGRLRPASVPAHEQEIMQQLETSAWEVRVHATSTVPALLQTASYVQEMAAVNRKKGWDDQQVARFVMLRTQRQAQLWDLAKRFLFVVHEAGLDAERIGVDDPEIRRMQLQYLHSISDHPNIDLRVISRQAKLPELLLPSFTLFDDSHVEVDIVLAAKAIVSADVGEVDFYRRLFDEVAELATPDESRQLLERLVANAG